MNKCINIGELQFWFQFLLRTNMRYLDWRMTVCCALPASGSVLGGGEREQEGKVPHRKGWRGDGVASRRSDASSLAGSGLGLDSGGVDG
jgi:hypothetical protein